MINGVRMGGDGAETREVVNLLRDGLASYDAFVWHYSATGLSHRTESLDGAIAFDAEQAKILQRMDAAEAAAQIVRQIRDEGVAFAVWVGVEEG